MSAKLYPRFVNARGVKTRYLDVGIDQPVLVGLHGGGAGSSGVAGMGLLAPRLQEQMRIVAPDQVGGFGQTDAYAPTPYGSQSRVDHLADFVDTLCLEKFHLVGNSQGAWVAARYAVQRPDRVKSLILIGSSTIGKAMGVSVPPSEGIKALQTFDGTRDGMRRLMNALVHDPASVTDALIEERLSSYSRPGAAEALKRFAEANRYLETDVMAGNFSLQHILPSITKFIPTLFIWGQSDTFALPEIGYKLEKLLPNVHFEYVANAGHQVQTDQPDVVADLVRKHISSVR